jgi:hypothetical protein
VCERERERESVCVCLCVCTHTYMHIYSTDDALEQPRENPCTKRPTNKQKRPTNKKKDLLKTLSGAASREQ